MEKQPLTRVAAFSVCWLFLAGLPAQATRQLGIDVSNHQGAGINWSTVKNADGITFAWAKATEGFTFNDADFTINETNAKAAGVFIGAYHFARPDNQIGLAGADQEASHFWSIASPYIKGGNAYLMPMLDSRTERRWVSAGAERSPAPCVRGAALELWRATSFGYGRPVIAGLSLTIPALYSAVAFDLIQ